MLTQDCAAPVLGYYPYSLREKGISDLVFTLSGRRE
jgi:hypothetical protein